MSDEQAKLDALFEAALAIESDEQRSVFVQQQCGDDAALREELLQRLHSARQESEPPERPLTHLDATQLLDRQRAASLDTGLATAFGEEKAVVLGSAGHSVLKGLGQTIDVPRVSLREAEGEVETPVERPGSAELPQATGDGRYRVDGEIARGGMGAILKGRDTDLGRDLAIKVLLDEHKDHPEVIQRFIEEAQIGGQLQHPGIAPVYELGQFADERPFFSMKLVKGQTLSRLLAERKDPAEDRGRFVGIFEQICQTLAYAHARGVIHRDLKPANIMVGAFGEVQVMDWGLAKVLSCGGVADERKAQDKHKDVSVIQTRRSTGSDVPCSVGSVGSQTQMGSVMGTPAYMPPEQALGEIDQLDQRADVFGLGAVLCEILTGKPPYVGENSTVVFLLATRGKLDDAFARLDASGADPELLETTKACLAPEPRDRPQDAGVLAERVSHYLESVESKLRSAEQERAAEAARVVEQRKRARVTLTLAAVVFAVLIAGISGTAWFASEANNNYRLAETRAKEEEDQRIRATAATRKAEAAVKASRRSLFDLNTEIGLIAAKANRPAEALLWFAEAAETVEEGSHEDQAGRIRHASWSESTPRLLGFIEHPDQTLQKIAYDSTGKFLATLTDSGKMTVWDVGGWAQSVLTDANQVDHVWHPKHARLATADEKGRVRVIEIPSGKVLHEIESHEPVSKLAYDPQSERVAICGRSIRLWNVITGALSGLSDMEEATIQSVSFSRDGSLVLAAYDDDRARLFNTKSSTGKPLLPPLVHFGTGFPGSPFLAPIFVNRDRGILTKSGGDIITWTEIGTGEPQMRIPVTGPNATSMRSSRNGDSFVVTGQTGQYQIWNALSAELLAEGHVRQGAWDADFTPDGLDLWLQTGREIQRRRAVDGVPFGSSIEPPTQIYQSRVSPDGRRIAIAHQGGGVAIWEWGSYLPYYLRSVSPDASAVLTDRFRQHLIRIDASRMKQSRSGDHILVCGSNAIFGTTRRVTLYSTADGAIVETADSESLILDACISPDERTLAFANLDQEIYVWRRGDSSNRRLLVTVDSEPLRIEFGPDATTLIVLQIDGTLSCFDPLSGTTIWQKTHQELVLPSFRRQADYHIYRRANSFPYMRFQLYDLVSGDDGRFFATTCGNNFCRVWNSRDGSLKIPPIRFGEEAIRYIVLSPDDRWLAIAGKTTAEVYDTANGKRQQRFDLSSISTGLFFDSTGRRLAICVESGECAIWDWQSRKQVCPVIRANDGVFFGKDSQWFLTDRGLGEDPNSEVTIWNTMTGKPLTPSWPIHARPDSNLLYSRDAGTWYLPSDLMSSIQLDDLIAPVNKSIARRKNEAEILSVRKVVQGKAVRLSASEWAQRILSMRESNPDFFASDRKTESTITWHQHQLYRGLADGNPHAARRHFDALSSILGDDYKDRVSHQAEVEFCAAVELARTNEPDEAARHVRLIAEDKADLFGVHWTYNGITTLHTRSGKLIGSLIRAGHKAEAKQVCKLILRLIQSRFGPEDGRVRVIKRVLEEDLGN